MKLLVYIILGIIIIAGAVYAYQTYYAPVPVDTNEDANPVTDAEENTNDEMMPVEPDGGIGDGAEPLPRQDPSVAAQAMIATAQDLELEGLSEEEAVQVAADNNVLFRVVERDGEPLAMTMDYRPGRINATVEAGVVTEYTIEGADSQ
jgi:hypothetical protein